MAELVSNPGRTRLLKRVLSCGALLRMMVKVRAVVLLICLWLLRV